jgi:TRAP-type C4-dicarboxylate transport system substrate-binding protein
MVKCFTLPLLEELKAATNGQIEIEQYMGGTGFAHPLRQYEQVARGVMDISQGVLSYSPGQFSMTEIATMPLLVDDPKSCRARSTSSRRSISPTSSRTSI